MKYKTHKIMRRSDNSEFLACKGLWAVISASSEWKKVTCKHCLKRRAW